MKVLLKLSSHLFCDQKLETKRTKKENKYPLLMIILHQAYHSQNRDEQVPPYLLVRDKGIAKEQDINPGAFEVFSGLMFKSLLPQDEGSNTIQVKG